MKKMKLYSLLILPAVSNVCGKALTQTAQVRCFRQKSVSSSDTADPSVVLVDVDIMSLALQDQSMEKIASSLTLKKERYLLNGS